MKRCPFCAEQIQDEAIVCRFCNRDLRVAEGRADWRAAGQPVARPSGAPRQPVSSWLTPVAAPSKPVPKKSGSTQIHPVVGCLMMIVVGFILLMGKNAINPDPLPPLPQQAATRPAEPVATPTLSQAEVRKQQAQEKKRQVAEAAKEKAEKKRATVKEAATMVKLFSDFQDGVNQHAQKLADILSAIDNGAVDIATAYNALEALQERVRLSFEHANAMEVPERYEEDKKTAVLVAVYLKDCIGSIKEYLDDKKPSTLASAQKDMASATQGNQILTAAVAQQALKDGYVPKAAK